tara:strand:+ start:23488 stop:23751 length:264 start_codon:yes stop_codon:yes gene_type:complete
LLIIEVTNAREVVRRRVGRLGERFIGKVFDAETQVEKALIQEMETAFQEFGIEAKIISVDGTKFNGSKSLEISLQIREERDVYIKNE